MKYFIFIISLVISNLSYSYENNQLLLNNEPKKVGYIELSTLKDKKINIFEGQENLKKNDSYNFLIRNKLLLNTGGTDTNNGDLVIMVMF